MEAWVVATGLIVTYLLATIVLGVIANRRMRVDLEDFLLCGRRVGFVVLYLTVVASFHSAFAFLGSGGFFNGAGAQNYQQAFGRHVVEHVAQIGFTKPV